MKKIFYVILPIVAFVIILSNALFGHLLFDSPYGQDINKYSIYVHLQDEWNSYPGNILFDVTNVWSNPDPQSDAKSHSLDPSDISTLTSYNQNQLQYQHQKAYVELKHEFSNCETNWKPIPYRIFADTLRNKVEQFQGTQLNDNPYVLEFPNVQNTKYGSDIQQEFSKHGYVQFIPICTSKESTSYEYAISLNDPDAAFDVYFVPSYEQVSSYLKTNSFEFYTQSGCSAQNYHSFSGSCENVGKKSGLMIILPDTLDSALAKVRVSLHEKL